jgi:2-phosphosulfolactate phosphatase
MDSIFGNSPFEISGVDFGGKTIIQRTSAGTQGIVGRRPGPIDSTRPRWSRRMRPFAPFSRIHPVRSPLWLWATMGVTRTDEDELCEIHLRNRLEGRLGDPDAFVG